VTTKVLREAGALVLTACTPEDIEPGDAVGGVTIVSFACPGSVDRYTHGRALGAAANMAALDSPVAVALAA
jgi:hypothetical protein